MMRTEIKMTGYSVWLLSITLFSVASAAIPKNSINIATGSKVISDLNDASNVIDGNVTTCVQANSPNETLTIDLGKEHLISGLYIHAGSSPGDAVGYIEIFVASQLEQGEGICKFNRPSTSRSVYVECYKIMQGRYVRLANPTNAGMKICNVQVIECLPNFYNQDCSAECRCLDGKHCEKTGVGVVPGECKSGCAAGFTGDNCSISCKGLDRFGPDCSMACHCKAGECDAQTGHCPGGCVTPWRGMDCQTKLPSLHGVIPETDKSTFNSISLKWPSWNGTIGVGFLLKYQILYNEYGCEPRESCLNELEVEHVKGQAFQMVTIGENLKINSRYEFEIVPLLVDSKSNKELGTKSYVGGPYKTKCIAPQAPKITSLDPKIDIYDNTPTAVLHITWKAPDDPHCNSIAHYKIQYSEAQSSIWKKLKADQSSTTKEITGLSFDTEYLVMVVAVNNELLDGSSDLEEIKTLAANAVTSTGSIAGGGSDQGNSATIIAVVVSTVILLVVIAVVVFVALQRQRRYKAVPKKDPQDGNDLVESCSLNSLHKMEKEHTPTNDSGVLVEDPCSHTPSSSAESFTQIKEPPPSVKPASKTSPEPVRKPTERFPIKIEELEEYVMERRDNDCKQLKDEYREFPEGIQKPCDHGRKQENKHKNRFVNIIAYDHSRVELEKVEGDEDSDYINANYIHGYKKENHYIASQGCNKWTIQDIWRLAWQKSCLRIVMVTNLVESGRRKCEQYWPEHMNEEKQYSEIFIKWIDCEQTSDFVIRTFELRMGEETRNLKQFHFTAWPDHGVPNRASPILAFRRKVRSFDESHPGNMLIHCSAGVGRTGTFINIDYNLEMAKDMCMVDVYNVTKEMRDNRVNMIQTEEQYIFVYDALLEALQTGDTAIPCSEFRFEFELLCKEDEEDGKSKLQREFENLQSVSPKVKLEDCEAAAKAENMDKNRDGCILPSDRHRPYLNTRVEGTNDYINAVFLDGYKSRNAHIITQMPLPITVIDFWRMVYEHNCGSIVMLNTFDANDDTSGQYWPDDSACECGPFIIEPVDVDDKNTDVVVRELKLKYHYTSSNVVEKTDTRTVNLFQYQAWSKDNNLPTNKTSVMALIDLVERSQYKTGNGPVLIHCYNGASQSGLYAAISCIWEKMKLEQEVDIYHTVKQLRYHRPQVIENLDQYKFCFEMVLAFLAEFETYANFR